MNLQNILTGLAVWTAVSIVAGAGIGHVLAYCAQSDSPAVATDRFQERVTSDSTLQEAA